MPRRSTAACARCSSTPGACSLPTEQRVCRHLSIFRGGWVEEAAGHVAGATLPALLALVDKSLLRQR